jgi:hypothetical protein
MKTTIPILVLAALLGGCATAPRMTRLSLGMTKPEVIRILGKPVSSSATDGVEYLNYRLSETGNDRTWDVTKPYFVQLKDGKVTAWGRHGDFDTVSSPEIRIRTESGPPADGTPKMKR